jgi:hypothetical protein
VVITHSKFRPAELDESALYVLRVWLHLSRRRLTLKQWAEDFARREGGDECVECEVLLHNDAERMPSFRVPLNQLVDIHEQSDEGLALTTQLDRGIWLVGFDCVDHRF